MDYQNGEFYKRTITFDPLNKQVIFSAVEGKYASSFKILKCIFHGFDGMKEVKVNGEEALLNGQTVKLLDGLKYLEDIYDPGYYKSLREMEMNMTQQIVTFLNGREEMNISWK